MSDPSGEIISNSGEQGDTEEQLCYWRSVEDKFMNYISMLSYIISIPISALLVYQRYNDGVSVSMNSVSLNTLIQFVFIIIVGGILVFAYSVPVHISVGIGLLLPFMIMFQIYLVVIHPNCICENPPTPAIPTVSDTDLALAAIRERLQALSTIETRLRTKINGNQDCCRQTRDAGRYYCICGRVVVSEVGVTE